MMRMVHTQQRRRLIMKLSLSDFERRNFLVLTFAGIINAIGVTIFLAPGKIIWYWYLWNFYVTWTINTFHLFTIHVFINSKHSSFSIRIKKTRSCFYDLCDLYGCHLFYLCMADRRCSSDQCKHCFSTCRNWSSSLFSIWWFDHWNSQWIFSSIWRSNGWNWSFGSYLF